MFICGSFVSHNCMAICFAECVHAESMPDIGMLGRNSIIQISSIRVIKPLGD